MPRLTTRQYLTNRAWLRSLWLEDRSRFVGISANEQWELRAYYVPSEDGSEDQLLQLRRVKPPSESRACLNVPRRSLHEARQSVPLHGARRGPAT
jgi:hypothetical protein